MKTKKITATILLATSLFGMSIPALANDVNINTDKNSTSATSIIVPIRAASYEVTGNYVRIRTAPGTASSTVGYLMRGDLVSAGHGVDSVYADGYYWLPVQVTTGKMAGKTGWVATNYLNEIG